MAWPRARSWVRPLALAAAALVSACAVEVEGAPCSPPGPSLTCPSGQACGNDGRCSARALACAASRCTPGVGGDCVDADGVPTTAVAKRCTDADPVCGKWIHEACTPNGFVCAQRTPDGGSPGAWCVCPGLAAGSGELIVRPGGSLAGQPPFATGAPSPAACNFGRLTDALTQADPGAVATVTAIGTDPATAVTVTFSAAATGETFPLRIAARVTLRSDAPAGGGTYRIVFDPETATTGPVQLHSGAKLAGFTVQNGAGGSWIDAISLSCDGPDPALLTSVVLDGAGSGGVRLGRGVVAGAGCALVARDVTVRNMADAGFLADAAATDPAPLLSITGGAITGCGDGVSVRFGHVVLQSVRIEGNARMGVRANADLTGLPRVEIRNSKVVGNGDTGIAVGNGTEVRITGTTSSGNGWDPAATAWGGLPRWSASRNAGGIVLVGNPPSGSLEFARNRIYGNGGDQLLVLGAATTWNLDGPSSCGSDAAGPLYSIIGCYDPTSLGTTLSYRGIVAVNANVSAQYWGWRSVTPSANEVGAFSGSVTPPTPNFCPGDANLCSEVP